MTRVTFRIGSFGVAAIVSILSYFFGSIFVASLSL